MQARELGLSSFLLPYNGAYYSAQRLVAYCGSFVSVAYAPHFYTLMAIATVLAVVAYVARSRLDTPFKPLLALSVVAIPTNGEMYLTLTNFHWILALALLVVLISQDPRNRRELTTDLAVAITVGLTGPFSVLWLPLFAVRTAVHRSRASCWLLAVVTLCACGQLTVLNAQRTSGVFYWFDLHWLGYFGNGIAGVLVLGTRFAKEIPNSMVLTLLSAGIYGALTVHALRKRDARRLMLLAAGAAIVASTAIAYRRAPEYLSNHLGNRYAFLPTVSLVWVLILTLESAGKASRFAALLLGMAALASLTRFTARPFVDFDWQSVSLAIGGTEPAKIPINPPGWAITYFPDTKGQGMAPVRVAFDHPIRLTPGQKEATPSTQVFGLQKRVFVYGVRFQFAPRAEQEEAARFDVRWNRTEPSVDGRTEELAPLNLRPGGPTQGTVWIFDTIDEFRIAGIRQSEAWEIVAATLYVKPSEANATLCAARPGMSSSADEPSWLPVAGDWDGDGIDTIGLFDPVRGRFYLSNRNGPGKADLTLKVDFPATKLLALAGDWDGDQITTPAVYQSEAGAFYLEANEQAVLPAEGLRLGPRDAGWLPLVGDWKGDGVETPGLYDPALSRFLLPRAKASSAPDEKFRFGRGGIGWLPVTGDWDGDGVDTVGLYDPKGGKFYLRNSNTAGVADRVIVFGPKAAGLCPLAGDWDGDGIETVGLYDPTGGRFLLSRPESGQDVDDLEFRFGPRRTVSMPPVQVSLDAIRTLPDWQTLQPQSILELGAGWSSNTINTVIFRHHALATRDGYQFGAFYRDSGALVTFRRDLETDTVLFHELDEKIDLNDAHDAISLGIDRSGRIHMSYPEHAGRSRYRRSRRPLSIEGWTGVIPMTGVREDHVTYPTFLMPPSGTGSGTGVVQAGLAKEVAAPSLLYLYRYGHSGRGDAYLKVYDDRQGAWIDRETPVLAGSQLTPWTCSPYWNHPAFDTAGRLHLSFVWRTHSLGPDRLVNNRNIDYAVSPDGGATWHTSRGHRLPLPITPANSETVQAISPGTSLINQTSSAVDSHGNPHVVYYAEDAEGIPQYQHLWFDGKAWRRNVLSRRTADFQLAGGGTLQIPMSRPEIVVGSDDTVYVLFRGDLSGDALVAQRLSAPDYQPQEAMRILWEESLGYAEPILDRTRWSRDGVLSMLVQKNHQPPHDRPVKRAPEPVFLVDWDLEKGW